MWSAKIARNISMIISLATHIYGCVNYGIVDYVRHAIEGLLFIITVIAILIGLGYVVVRGFLICNSAMENLRIKRLREHRPIGCQLDIDVEKNIEQYGYQYAFLIHSDHWRFYWSNDRLRLYARSERHYLQFVCSFKWASGCGHAGLTAGCTTCNWRKQFLQLLIDGPLVEDMVNHFQKSDHHDISFDETVM